MLSTGLMKEERNFLIIKLYKVVFVILYVNICNCSVVYNLQSLLCLYYGLVNMYNIYGMGANIINSI